MCTRSRLSLLLLTSAVLAAGCGDDPASSPALDTLEGDTSAADTGPSSDVPPTSGDALAADSAAGGDDLRVWDTSAPPAAEMSVTACTFVDDPAALGPAVARIFAPANGDLIVQYITAFGTADDSAPDVARSGLVRYRRKAGAACELERVAGWGTNGEYRPGDQRAVSMDLAGNLHVMIGGAIATVVDGVETHRCNVTVGRPPDHRGFVVSPDGSTAFWTWSESNGGPGDDRAESHFMRADTTSCAAFDRRESSLGTHLAVIGTTIYSTGFISGIGNAWGYDFDGAIVWQADVATWEGEDNTLWEVRALSDCAGHPCVLQANGDIVQFHAETGALLGRVRRAGGPSRQAFDFAVSPNGHVWVMEAQVDQRTEDRLPHQLTTGMWPQ